jgi:O-antigen/teichoic acid export membrane protein
MTGASGQAEPVADTPCVASPAPDELLSRVLRNSFWLLNSSLLVRALNLLRGIILARLLFPDDFGLFGLATAIIGFAAMFNDIGAGIFLIYRPHELEEHADTAFWTNLGISTALALGMAAAAPLVGRFYGRPDVVPVLLLMALSTWLQTASTVHRNLLRRDLRFRALAATDAAVNIAAFVVAVGFAWAGWGVWAFVFSSLFGNVINALLLGLAYRWRPRWRISRSSFMALAPFSGWYVGQAVAWYLVFNLDNLLVGKVLGIGALGIYGLAYNYALLPVTLVAGSLGGVVFPELARLLPVPSRFWPAYFQSSRLLSGAVCPIAAALAVSAPDLIPSLFGAKWNAAILPFQMIAVYGAVRCLWTDPFGALGRFDLSFWHGCITAAAGFVAIYFGTRYGTAGVAVAVLIVIGASHIATLYVATRSAARVWEGLRNAAPYLLAGAGAAVLGLGARYLCVRWVSGRKELLTLVTLGVIFGSYALVFRRHLGDLWKVFLSRATPISEQGTPGAPG